VPFPCFLKSSFGCNRLVRCFSAFAHTPTSPTSLDSRCSAIGPEPESPDNGQAIDAGQAAASIHRMHHSNERPVGGAKIGHAEGPASAAGTVLSPCYILPPHACSRHKLLAPGPPTCYHSVPPDHPRRKKRGNSVQNSPRMPCGSRWYLRKANWPFGEM
jgi:hypothetical protein